MYKIGLSSGTGVNNEEMFKGYADAGIDAMEICVPRNEYPDIDYKAIEKYAKQYGIKLWSYHLSFGPFDEVDPSSVDAEVRKHTIELYSEQIKRAADIGIDKFVIHPSGEPIDDSIRAEKMLCAKECHNELCEIAAKEGGVLCIENLPRTCLGKNSAEIKELLSANDKLRTCFDTNHLLKQDTIEFIKDVGDKIVTLHVSDYDFMNERHWLPGEGQLNWAEILKALKEIKYDGVWMYEISRKCPKTIIRDRDLTFDDFALNSKELFEGKPLTVFSTHKETLGMWE